MERVEVLTSYLPPLEERYRVIEELDASYMHDTGNHLPPFLLELLGTWYIQETYSDNRANKVALEEYPILTESQLYRRGKKGVLIGEEIDIDMLKYHKDNNSSVYKSRNNKENRGN